MPRLDGFDAAHYQFDHGDPDLAATLIAGLWWIAWKVTQSIAYVDPTFAPIRAQWTGFRCRGLYHWLSSTKDVATQAAHYLHTIGTLRPGEFAMLDAEEKGITVAMCLRWCELVESVTHRPVVIYSGLYVAGGTIWKSPELRMSKYGPRPFIVAAYVTEANLLARMTALGCFPHFDRHAWQFSSNGPVPGIAGRCDMDQIDNVAAFLLACAIDDIPVPIPGPTPEPPQGDDMQNYYVVAGSNARFIGTPALVRWTGLGDAKVEAAIATQLAAGNLVLVDLTGGPGAFAATFLEGDLPTGDTLHQWTGDEFANAAEIKARGTANGSVEIRVTKLEAATSQLNDAVGRNGQEIHEVKVGLVRAGGG